jgi:hypothetical protein
VLWPRDHIVDVIEGDHAMKKRYHPLFYVLAAGFFLLGAVSLSGPRFVAAAAPPHQEPQEVDITLLSEVVDRWHKRTYREYAFNKWTSLGDIFRFNERIADGDVQVYIDPVQLAKRDANALYEDCVGFGCSTYFNDIIIADMPDKVLPQTLWHEMMHAIFDAHDSDLLVDNDEIYTWYMEGVNNNALPVLVRYEAELAKGEDCDQKKLDDYWAKFEERMEEAKNTGEGFITADAQVQQLRQLTGFYVDPAAIRQGYVDAGMDKCAAVTPTPGAPSATLSDLDLIFCIDVTGSMEDDIASVKAAASDIVNAIAAKNDDYRVAIVAYRDWDDSMGYPMFEDYAFSGDRSAVIANINRLSVGGGDDTPEAVFEALMRAIDSQAVGGWRNNVNKQIILMGDAPPHNPSRQGFTPAIVAKAAEDADPVVIQAVVVGNDGYYDAEAVEAFRELAELTRGDFFEADDASKVPQVLEETIEVIQPPSSSSALLSRASLLLIGALCCIGVVIVAVLVFVVLFWGKKRRRPTSRAPAAVPTPPASAPRPSPSPAHWQGETMVASPAVVAELAVEEGPDGGQRFPLRESTRLGRATDNDIVLRDPQVSRHHAVINLTGTEYVIADLGSANGTKVNGVRIDQPCPLRHGDVVVVGSEQLVFRQR